MKRGKKDKKESKKNKEKRGKGAGMLEKLPFFKIFLEWFVGGAKVSENS